MSELIGDRSPYIERLMEIHEKANRLLENSDVLLPDIECRMVEFAVFLTKYCDFGLYVRAKEGGSIHDSCVRASSDVCDNIVRLGELMRDMVIRLTKEAPDD
jgi:hypothetical protein